MRKSLDRLTRQALTAMYALETAEIRYGRQHNSYHCAKYKYKMALEELGEGMTARYGYPVRRIGPRSVPEVEKMRKAG